MNETHLRMSDAERDQAAAELGEHYAQGRIDGEEHAERLDRIWAARTRGELAPIFADLPGHRMRAATSIPRSSPQPRSRGPRWRGIPFPVVLLLILLVGATVLTHLPLVLIGVFVWFLVSRGGCRPRSGRVHWS